MVTEKANTTEYGLLGGPIHTVVSSEACNQITLMLERYVLSARFTFSQSAKWQTASRLDDVPAEAIEAAHLRPWSQDAIVRARGLIVHLVIDPMDGDVDAKVFGPRFAPGDLEAALDQVRVWLPQRVSEEDRVSVMFRFDARRARGVHTRYLEAPAWSAIRSNYSAAVATAVDQLMSCFNPGQAGRLLLLHGAPGTGKTYVIRALARAWREWCGVEYIADPDLFFGRTEYMMTTLINPSDDDGDTWRLLVIEDAGELLARDARASQGQGLSRLLNVTEGLIGQGQRLLVLITTNEHLSSLNPAVARPGRTAAEIEFTPLSVDEANRWLAAHGRLDLGVDAPATLAELFALVSDERIATRHKREPLGFLKG